MKKFTIVMAAGMALGLMLHGCSTAPPGSKEEAVNKAWEKYSSGLGASFTTPLPDLIRIVPPGPDVSPAYAAFSGGWAGSWDGSLDGGLVVERITPPTAIVIYSWGQGSSFDPGWTRVRGTFKEGVLQIELRRPAIATYSMRPDGKLDGTYEWDGGVAYATLTKVQ